MLSTRLKAVALVLLLSGTLGGSATLATFAAAAGPPRDSQSAQPHAAPDGGAKARREQMPNVDGIASSRERKPKLVDAGGAVEALAWSPDGKLLVTQVNEWSPSPDGGTVNTGRALQIRDAETGAVRRTLYDEFNVRGARFSPDGMSVAAALAGENVVKLWDPSTGKEKSTFEGAQATHLASVAFSRDGRLLAAAGVERVLILWDADSGKLLWQVHDEVSPNAIYATDALAFAPDGKLLAMASKDETAKLWDTATGECKHTLRGHKQEGQVFSLAFSPDGKLLASAGLDGTVLLWDPDSGKVTRFLTSGYLMGLKLVVAFSADGRCVAVGGSVLGIDEKDRGGDVRIFDANTGKLVQAFSDMLREHSGVSALAFSPSGETLAVGTWNKQLLLLPLQK